MKNSLFSLLALLLFSQSAFAQVGVKGGIQFSTVKEESENVSQDDIENRSIVAPVLGLTFALKLGNSFYLQPELLYSQGGGRNSYTVAEVKTESQYRINYFELPVLAKIQLGDGEGEGIGFHVAAGPWLGYALSGKSKFSVTSGGTTIENEEDFTFDNRDDAERMNYGLIGAAGVSLGKLTFDLRYNYGLNNLVDSDADNNNDDKPVLQTRGVALTAAYRF